MNQIQEVIDECNSKDVSEPRLIELLKDARMLVRSNAMMALARRSPEDSKHVSAALLQAACSETAKNKVLGNMNERMLAAFALRKMKNEEASKAYRIIRQQMTPNEIDDLDWQISNGAL